MCPTLQKCADWRRWSAALARQKHCRLLDAASTFHNVCNDGLFNMENQTCRRAGAKKGVLVPAGERVLPNNSCCMFKFACSSQRHRRPRHCRFLTAASTSRNVCKGGLFNRAGAKKGCVCSHGRACLTKLQLLIVQVNGIELSAVDQRGGIVV